MLIFSCYIRTGYQELEREKTKQEQEIKSWSGKWGEYRIYYECVSSIISYLHEIHTHRKSESERVGSSKAFHFLRVDDKVVPIPPSKADYKTCVLPETIVHKLSNQGHFSYLFLCDELHTLHTIWTTKRSHSK